MWNVWQAAASDPSSPCVVSGCEEAVRERAGEGEGGRDGERKGRERTASEKGEGQREMGAGRQQ